MPASPSLFKGVDHVYPFAVVPLVGARIACRFLCQPGAGSAFKEEYLGRRIRGLDNRNVDQRARERSVTQSPNGSTVTLRQCDLRRTVTMDEANQTYLLTDDPQDENAAKAAALATGSGL